MSGGGHSVFGTAPTGWRVVSVRHLAAMQSGEGITSTAIQDEGPYRVFGGNGLRGYTTHFTHDGEFVLIGRQGALCGNVHRVAGRFWASEHAVVARPRGHHAGWLAYVLGAMDLGQYSVAAAQPGLAVDRIKALLVPLPPLPEQRAIADFLDQKTAAIDALIAKKERLLALLDEKRQALITQAVTKGLDPSVPMKDSGIDLVGEVPMGWRVVRLKHIARVRTGIPKGRILDGPTVSVPYLRVANVQAGYLDLDDVTEMRVLPSDVQRFALHAGDVLMNEGGDNDKLGRGTVWRGQIHPCTHQNHVFAVRPHDDEMSNWIALSTLGAVLRAFFQGRAKQSTNLASISSTNLKEAPIALPPRDVRRSIEESLARQLDYNGRQREALLRSTSRLREYRQALITAAVTGQLDVRTKQARAMEPAA